MTISRGGEKKQRQLLCDSLLSVHKKYCEKYPLELISYVLICMHRPFWVVVPKMHDQEICLCKLHKNDNSILQKFLQLKVFLGGCSTVDRFVKKAVCLESNIPVI